jgi:TolB-like protein/Tfp pilus assembly protein PilF
MYPTMPNKLSQFWQELKRRNVTRVLAVYIASAFMLLELVDMISEPFGLPDWSMKAGFFILLAGLFITLVISWIYDIQPEGGMIKTGPADEVKPEDIPRSSNSWKIASYVSFVVIVGLIILNIIPRTGNKDVFDASIAVLPFINDSPVSENEHAIDGYMTAVHNNLCKIKALRVLTLQSTEQYRDQTKSIPEIARELGVGYLLSARGQIINRRIQLTVQLANADDKIIWSTPYDRQIELVEDHIDIQSDIAQVVAGEIRAMITPEEKVLMGKIPTTSLSAYDLYQRGLELFYDYVFDRGDLETLERAENYYHEALRIDSSYALAYVGLADISWAKTTMEDYFEDNFLDSVLVLVNRALSYDDQSSEAYTLRGLYYREIGRPDLTIKDLETAIRFNPNHGRAYGMLAGYYFYTDFIKSAVYAHKASSIDRGPRLELYLSILGTLYYQAGFPDISINYLQEHLKLTDDSAHYYWVVGGIRSYERNYTEAIEFLKKAIEYGYRFVKRDLARNLVLTGQTEEALEVYESWIIDMEERGVLPLQIAHRIAYAYWINGLEEEAEYYFDQQIEYCTRSIEGNRPLAQYHFAYYDLAAVYAFRGEKEKAFENLRKFNQAAEGESGLHWGHQDLLFFNLITLP